MGGLREDRVSSLAPGREPDHLPLFRPFLSGPPATVLLVIAQRYVAAAAGVTAGAVKG